MATVQTEKQKTEKATLHRNIAIGAAVGLGFLYFNDTAGLAVKNVLNLDPSADNTWNPSDEAASS